MANKAAIAIGLGAAAAAIAALAGGGVARAAEPGPAKKLPPAKTPIRVTLAKRFAKVFGVPSSLVLATIRAQSSNNPSAYRANKRGGSWGYGQMTLSTATEIYPRAKTKLAKAWDGTGKGLLDPVINIGLTAYYLSLWWKRYKANPRNWMLSAYAYVLGPGRVRAVVPDDSRGKLPKPLPADFARTKTRFASALEQSDIKRALAEDLVKPNLSGLGAAPLVGKALSKTISATTTGYQARAMFGLMTGQLSNAYGTLRGYDPTGLAKATRIDAGSIDAARKYLDSTNAMLSKYYAQMPESGAVLTSDQLTKLKTAVSTSSVAVKTVDDLFGTSFWKEFGAEIAQAAKTVASKVNTGIGFSAGMIAAGAVGVGFLILAIKK
jgi:soluble lytic murein transglycosylase-like protein